MCDAGHEETNVRFDEKGRRLWDTARWYERSRVVYAGSGSNLYEAGLREVRAAARRLFITGLHLRRERPLHELAGGVVPQDM